MIKKELGCEPIYNEKVLKTKSRSYVYEAADFHDNEISKVGSNYTSLAVILINFFFKKDENYYLQMFSKECKHIEEKKVIRYITKDLENFPDSDEFYEE